MECVISNSAKKISNDPEMYANRYNEFDLELVDPALAWDWNITNPYTGNFDHWISGATFKNDSLANVWWEDRGLDTFFYYDWNPQFNYWDVKQKIEFHNELVVLKYKGIEGYEVEGSLLWKKGRFIFQVGNITKTTADSLINFFLVLAMEEIFDQTKFCHLFEPIIELKTFVFEDVPNDTYYVCETAYPLIYPIDTNDQLLDSFNDNVHISIISNGNAIKSWEQKTVLCDDKRCFPVPLDQKLSVGIEYNNINIQVQYQDIIVESTEFNIRQICSVKFTDYPEEIEFGETILLTVQVDKYFPEFLGCDIIKIEEVFTGWKEEIYLPESKIYYTCPGKSEMGNIDELWFIINSCFLSESLYADEIFISIEDAVVEPDDGFHDIYIFGGEDDDYGASIAAGGDPTEILITGQFAGSAAFVDTDLISGGEDDVYIGKWNYVTNKFEWLQSMGSSTESDRPAKVVWNVGTTEIDCTIMSGDTVNMTKNSKMLICPPGSNVVNARMDQNGEVKWAIASGQIETGQFRKTDSYHKAKDTRSDQEGNCLIAGYFRDNISFIGADSISNWSATGNTDYDNLFLVKISNSGVILWGFSASGNDDVEGRKITIDKVGNIFLAASYNKSVNLEGYEFNEERGAFLAKFNPNGEMVWLKDIKEQCYIYGMELDNEEEHFFITGRARHDCDFAGMIWENTEPEYTRLFYAKFSVDGEPIWIKHGGTTSEDESHWPQDLAIDKENNLYITGYFREGNLSFSSVDLVPDNFSSKNNIIFTAAFDEDGNVLWADKAADNSTGTEDSNSDNASGIAIDDLGNCYVTGSFKNPSEFGGNTVTGHGEKDAFIARVKDGELVGLKSPFSHIHSTIIRNYPNPFNQHTILEYFLSGQEFVQIRIYNTFGEVIKELVNEIMPPGIHKILFDAAQYPEGIYIYQLNTMNYRISEKMVIVR